MSEDLCIWKAEMRADRSVQLFDRVFRKVGLQASTFHHAECQLGQIVLFLSASTIFLLNKNIHELQFGILFHAILLFPLAGEESHRAVLSILDEKGVGGFFKCFDISQNPGAALIGKMEENSLYAIFIFKRYCITSNCNCPTAAKMRSPSRS